MYCFAVDYCHCNLNDNVQGDFLVKKECYTVKIKRSLSILQKQFLKLTYQDKLLSNTTCEKTGFKIHLIKQDGNGYFPFINWTWLSYYIFESHRHSFLSDKKEPMDLYDKKEPMDRHHRISVEFSIVILRHPNIKQQRDSQRTIAFGYLFIFNLWFYSLLLFSSVYFLFFLYMFMYPNRWREGKKKKTRVQIHDKLYGWE